MNKQSLHTELTTSFLFTEGVIYTVFLAGDLLGAGEQVIGLKYAGILLCLAYILSTGSKLFAGAMFLTCCADWFLLIRGDLPAVGVTLFLFVQLFYLLYLYLLQKKLFLFLRMLLAGLLIGLLFRLNMVTTLNVLAMLYFSQLLVNTVLAWTFSGSRLFLFGLVLFGLGDICVGIAYCHDLFPSVIPFAAVGIWLFYFPSQVLIALSSKGEST